MLLQDPHHSTCICIANVETTQVSAACFKCVQPNQHSYFCNATNPKKQLIFKIEFTGKRMKSAKFIGSNEAGFYLKTKGGLQRAKVKRH